MMPGALTDFYGKQNDTLNYKLSTRAYTDYGNMYVKLKNVKRFPVILELINDKGEVLESAYSEKETQLDFKLLEPRKYILRLIYDDNKNGEWDTGDYLKKIQPEEVIYKMDEKNPKKIKEVEVRAIWDWEEDFDAGG